MMYRKSLFVIWMLGSLMLAAGCGKTQENNLQTEEALSKPSAVEAQAPEEGYYSNDFGEILRIERINDGAYKIEFSITHLLYMDGAAGTYDADTGILHFSGKDDYENSVEADIKKKGDWLQVTVTKSNLDDIVGMTQDFYREEEVQ